MIVKEKKEILLKEMEETVNILKYEENLENISKGIFILTKLSRIYSSLIIKYEPDKEYLKRLIKIKIYVIELKDKLLLKEANSLDEKDYKVKSLYTLENFSIPKSKEEAESEFEVKKKNYFK